MSKPDRPYGEEYQSDVYDEACRHECRLGCGDACIERGWCRLKVTPDRRARVHSIFLDNRRGVMSAMAESGQARAVITQRANPGLPYTDPVAVYCVDEHAMNDRDDPMPYYSIRAEGLVMDGPLRITILAERARLDEICPKRGKKA